jgi:hypothetical protein
MEKQENKAQLVQMVNRELLVNKVIQGLEAKLEILVPKVRLAP